MSTEIGIAPQAAAGSKLDAALAWAARGFRVFPIQANGKLPVHGQGWTTSATTDPDVIRDWWTRRDPVVGAVVEQDYNVACLTSDLVVADADIKAGKPGLQTFFDLGFAFDTLTVLTPTGGYHAYHKSIGREVGNSPLGPGLDVRSHHGFVVAPGSTIEVLDGDGEPTACLVDVRPEDRARRLANGAAVRTAVYKVDIDLPVADVPQAVLPLLKAPYERARRGEAPVGFELDLPVNVAIAENWLRHEAPIAIENQGGDLQTFKNSCRLHDFGVSEQEAFGLLLDFWNARNEPPWSPDELETKVANAYQYAKGEAGCASPVALFGDVVDVPRSPTPPLGTDSGAAACAALKARPFVWKDPKLFPRRRWVYDHHLIRKFFSCTFAPGGIGKTNLVLVEAISLAIGRSLLGKKLHEGPLHVWVLNLEDPLEELERRVIAICLQYQIDPAQVCSNLFLNSGRDTEIVIATTTRNGTVIATPIVETLKATIKENNIDVVFLDPFVSAHRVIENDNGAIDAICKVIGRIADETDTAWDLVHHVRKGHGLETTVEDGRGAVSLLAASRSARVLNRMTKDEASRAGVGQPRDYFRVDNGKANLAPPPDRSDWYHLENVSLGNHGPNLFDEPSDQVGVVEEWQWPAAAAQMTDAHRLEIQKMVREGEWRENSQTKSKWVGNVVANVLSLDVTDAGHRGRIRGIIDSCIKIDVLKLVHRQDGKREMKAFVEVGEWAPTLPAGPLGGTA